jgi:hypothetical protein
METWCNDQHSSPAAFRFQVQVLDVSTLEAWCNRLTHGLIIRQIMGSSPMRLHPQQADVA